MIDPHQLDEVWLTLAVVGATLPDEASVLIAAQRAQKNPATLLASTQSLTTAQSFATASYDRETVRQPVPASRATAHGLFPVDDRNRKVRVVTDITLVDVSHTAVTTLATGLQRVAREVARRWTPSPEAVAVAWTARFEALRRLTEQEQERIARAVPAPVDGPSDPADEIIVPWRCRYILAEVTLEPPRVTRLSALARFSGTEVCAIGYDLIPVTCAETTQPDFPVKFAVSLAALRHSTRIAAISQASAAEYLGWGAAMQASGLVGPRITVVELPSEPRPVTPVEMRRVTADFRVDTRALVLVVGSHEPRKNHLAVLHAAELLWREGLDFALAFIGGNSWGAAEFTGRLAQLQLAGRAVTSTSKASEDTLWASYTVARFTVFPSLNEGYGLPVAESLSVGTPVITSNFGSMADIAAGGGCLTVDPRDEHAIRDAMRRLLTDETLLAGLTASAGRRPLRTWDQYADELWHELTSSVGPGASQPLTQ
jgi:glycosyltransferase involved in cell wall biosynthesis